MADMEGNIRLIVVKNLSTPVIEFLGDKFSIDSSSLLTSVISKSATRW